MPRFSENQQFLRTVMAYREKIDKLKGYVALEEAELKQLQASLASKQETVRGKEQALAQAELRKQELNAMLGNKELGKLSAAEMQEKTELTNSLRNHQVSQFAM